VNSFQIKSHCKINLTLKVKNKLNSGYHNITSLITFCALHDSISISKTHKYKDEIVFTGKFKKGINKKSNTISRLLKLLRSKKLLKDQFFKINIKKNIPHGSGLGGGSSNAADLLNYFDSKINLKMGKKKKEKLARIVGFDVPISLERKNSFLTGKKDEIIRLKKKFNLNLLIVYPNIICSTQRIFKENKKRGISKIPYFFDRKSNKKIINFLKIEKNDLEQSVIKIYPEIKKIIEYIQLQKGCYFSRITGSGSACIGIFSSMKNTLYARKMIKLKYPKYWCAVSKTM
jgi:4-diphosphocytidyl-2-C-methyl-D-erythritol kinase